jgi:hypothetical protein
MFSGLCLNQLVNFNSGIPNFTLDSFLENRVNKNFTFVDELPIKVVGDTKLHVACRFLNYLTIIVFKETLACTVLPT